MRLAAIRVPGLPSLGWVATIQRGEPDVTVLHGDMVETGDDAFVAGVWDGPFADFAVTEATTLMGSGGRVTDNAVTFCNATHPFDQIYSVRADDAVHVSNSLPLLLARTDDGPDLRYRRYRADRAKQLWRGSVAPPASLPTHNGREVLAHLATDLVVGDELSITVIQKPAPRAPQDFAHYRAMLAETLHRLVSNGTDPLRFQPLRTLTTISNGYDSAMASVLAAEAGIRDALTLASQGSQADSGQGIGEQLGLGVKALAGDAWKQQAGEFEIEFAASSSGPVQFPLVALDEQWRDSMVLVGSLGDDLWDREHGELEEHLSQPGSLMFTPSCVHEFGLRAGIVFVHVPLIGAVHCVDIWRITKSAEMAPWTTGSDYDRPIPRRIIEEAGIPRGSFATHKYASAATSMDESFGLDTRADFQHFWKSAIRAQPAMRGIWYRLEGSVITPFVWRTTSLLRKLHAPRRIRLRMRWWSYHQSLPSAYQFHWSVLRLIDRYRPEIERTLARNIAPH